MIDIVLSDACQAELITQVRLNALRFCHDKWVWCKCVFDEHVERFQFTRQACGEIAVECGHKDLKAARKWNSGLCMQ